MKRTKLYFNYPLLYQFRQPFHVALIALWFFASCNRGFAQNIGINSSGVPADSSAILDVSSTNKGLLIPRMTTAQRNAISNPAQALQIFNTTTNCVEIYLGRFWQTLACGCIGAPAAPGAIAGQNSPCLNQFSAPYSISAVSGATSYTWTVPIGASIEAGQGTASILVNFGAVSGNVSVIAINGCGSSTASSLAVTINNSPPTTPNNILGPDTVCPGITGVTYSVAPVSGASSYTWTVPTGDTIVSGLGTNSITVNFGTASGSISVLASNGCGNSGTQYFNVAVAPPFAPGTISGPSSASFNETGVSYYIVPPPGAGSYSWTATGATISGSSTGSSVSVNFGTSGTATICVTVTSSNGCGTATNCKAVNLGSCYVSGNDTAIYSGSIESFTVPCGVSSITVQAYGAMGGASYPGQGGNGAYVTGVFSVSAGQQFKTLVGGAGIDGNGGTGGGGTFFTSTSNVPYLIAGGGGGAGYSIAYNSAVQDGGACGGSGCNGSTGSCGTPGTGGSSGSGGNGGTCTQNGTGGSGGGGLNGNGTSANGCGGYPSSQGGMAFVNGGAGGIGGCNNWNGGFGGGGAGGCNGGGGGGGGGYSGGGGGNPWCNDGGYGGSGGGGGCYNSGANQTLVAGGNSNSNGLLIISW